MSTLDARQQIQIALQRHQVGDLAAAESVYREVLALNPDDSDALHLLANICSTTGRREVAIELISRACAVTPGVAVYHNTLGNILRESDHLPAAIQAYEHAIEIDTEFAEAWNNLGNALGDLGQIDQAIDAYRTALKLNPKLDRACSNLGVALREKGELLEAISALEKAIELNPTSSVAHDNLGIALREHGEIGSAIISHNVAIQLKPDSAPAHSNLSIALRSAGRLDEAIAAARKAISIAPNYAEAYNNLGVALAGQSRPDEAIEGYCRALALKPGYGDACTNLGVSLAETGDFARSLALCQKAVDLDPNNSHAHFNLAVILLLMGQFQPGWEQYEWRWKCKGLLPSRQFAQPRWDGGELNGRRILVHAEQGLGDTIQFIRYIPLIAGNGGRVILECQPELARLLQTVSGVDQIVMVGSPSPAFDLHCPIASLPYVCRTDENSIPPGDSYIRVDPALRDKWRKVTGARTPTNPRSMNVGLAWAGKPAHQNDRNRSLRLSQLAPLAMGGIMFHSLQKGPATAQMAESASEIELTDFTSDLIDFADTAGLIANLDMVISVDTSVAHLAAAMGKPVWLMIPFNPDWRWLLDRGDTPWYPTMRLFRQRSTGDWDDVIRRVKLELEAQLTCVA